MFAEVCRGLLRFTGVCRFQQRSAKISRGLKVPAEVNRQLQGLLRFAGGC